MAITLSIHTKSAAMMSLQFLFIFLASIAPFFQVGAAEYNLLVIRNKGNNFEEAVKGLSQTLDNDFTISEVIIEKETKSSFISDKISEIKPNIIVLMDNNVIKLYREYQASLSADAFVIPTVSIMGVLIDEAISSLKNATGILYEIPMVTSAVNFRLLVGKPITSVGIAHRSYLQKYVDLNRKYCENEGIKVVSTLVTEDSKILEKSVIKLVTEDKIDMLWLPNDNMLLTPTLLQSFWIPTVKKYKLPVIVGAEILVQPKFSLGSFAVIPDHVALGSQAAELVLNAMDNEWVVEAGMVEQPISVYQVVNKLLLEKKYPLSSDNLMKVDKVIE